MRQLMNREIKAELLEICEQLIALPSMNPPGREAAVIDYLEAYCTEAGLRCHRLPCGLEKGRENLLALLPGQESGQGLLFTGHSDVVPVPEEERKKWLTDPFRPALHEGRLYGRGACDMKSGLAAVALALAELGRQGWRPRRDLGLLVTVDEEDGMQGSRSLQDSPLLRPFRSLIVAEPTGLKLCSRSRGRTYGILHCLGQTAHGSRPEAGCNALLLAHELLKGLLRLDFSTYNNADGESQLRPLGIHAQADPWVIPDRCSLRLDARLTTGHDPADIWERITGLTAELEAKYTGRARFYHEVLDSRESWRSADCWLLRRCKEVLQERGLPTEEQCFTGTTDGTPLRRSGMDVIILGPGDLSLAHQANESVDLGEVQLAYEIYRNLMREN